MATTNQKTGNPSNALKRQVQTLVVEIERLIQWNHELERQLEQQNNREPNDQNDKQNRDEHNNDHPPTNDHQERDDQEESNAISRCDQQDTSCPSELEVSALRMV